MNHITIIMPAYNVEKYVGIALDSLIQQTHTDWSCFVMNDGSTDNTPALLKDYAEKDKRIKIFSQENKGLTKTYNNLLRKAEETEEIEYLFILDSDDFIHPKTFELLLKELKQSNADVAETPWKRVDAKADLTSVPDLPAEINTTILTDLSIYFSKEQAKGDWFNKWNKLYKWNKIKHLRFDEELTYEDDFWYETLVHHTIDKKVMLNVPLYYYRSNATSLTKSLKFEKYVKSGIRRVNLSWETFVKTGKVPAEYQAVFMADLTKDAYRMILQKNVKKNKNKIQRKELFLLAAEALKDLVENQKINPKYLSFFKRLALWSACHRYYFLTRLFVKISAF